MNQKFYSPVVFDRGPSIGATTKAVTGLNDLPDPVGGVITLEDDTVYQFYGLVNIGTNTIACGTNNAIVGGSPAHDGILYTGSGNAIEASEKTVYLRQISIVGATGGVGIDYTDSVGASFLNVINCAFIGLTTAANIDGADVVSFQNTLFRECDNGVIKESTSNVKKIVTNTCFFESTPNDAAGEGIEVKDTSTLGELDILNCKFVTNLGTCINVVSADTITNTATLFNNRFLGTATYLTGVDFSTERFNLLLNDGVEDSRINGQYGFSGNSTATTITTQNAWVKIGIATTASLLSGFTHTSPNTLTYVRRRDRVCQLNVSGGISSSGVNTEVEVGIFVNGTLDISTPVTLRAANVNSPISTNFQVQLAEDDEIDVRIRNTSGTENLTVAALQVTAHAVN